MTNTAELYSAPAVELAATTTPDLIGRLTYLMQVTSQVVWLPYAATQDNAFEQSMRELARLSMEPDSLARDSEGNVWGFGADA